MEKKGWNNNSNTTLVTHRKNKEENNLSVLTNVKQFRRDTGLITEKLKKIIDDHWEWRRWLIVSEKTRNKSISLAKEEIYLEVQKYQKP